MTAILALDQGTTGSTALVVHQDGRILGRGYREVPQHYPEPGWVEHDPEDLFRGAVEAMREAVARSGVVPIGLGITNQRETVVLWDRRTLAPVHRAIVWQDRRTTARCEALRAEGRTAWLGARTGLVPDPYFSATKLEWLLRDPALRARAERGELAAGTVDSWLVARLTGGRVHVTDHSNASRTLLYNLHTRARDPELLALFGVPAAVLPQIVPSAAPVAETDAEHLGQSLLIAGLAGDQQAALFGQGCDVPGLAKNTYGTGAFLLIHAGDAPPAPPAGVLATAAAGRVEESPYALEGSVLVAGAAVQWLRDGLGLVARADETEALARSVPDAGGVTFVPAFAGLGTPHWEPNARGTLVGLTRGTTRAHLVRATLEAIALSSADLVEAMGAGGHRPALLRVDGGASANDFLMQFQADILGLPLERPDMLETTALGAAALAGLALGVWRDRVDYLAGRRFTRFEPGMAAGERVRRLGEWRRAIGAARQWAAGAAGTE